MNYVTEGWNRIKQSIDSITDFYTLHETKKILSNNNFYKTFFGRARNRTMIKYHPKLYKSVMEYSQPLEDIMKSYNRYKGTYNFKYRLKFIVELDCDLNKLKCQCGKQVGWTPYCRQCPEPKKTWEGRNHTSETKQKQRISTLNYIESMVGQIAPRYNKSSIPIIEAKAKELGITDLQHAENGGEFRVLGYFVDGYSKETNTVIEFHERHHYKVGNLSERDVRRQKEIQDHLKCEWVIIDGRNI